jgi:hypothetical protein
LSFVLDKVFCMFVQQMYFMEIFPWLGLYCTNPFLDLVVFWVLCEILDIVINDALHYLHNLYINFIVIVRKRKTKPHCIRTMVCQSRSQIFHKHSKMYIPCRKFFNCSYFIWGFGKVFNSL